MEISVGIIPLGSTYLKIIIIIFYFIILENKSKKTKTSYVVKQQGVAGGRGCVFIVQKYRGFFSFVSAPCSLSFFRESFTGASAKFCRCSCEHKCGLGLEFFNTNIQSKRHHVTSFYLVCIYVQLYMHKVFMMWEGLKKKKKY